MKRILRWIAIVLGFLIVLLLVGWGVIYFRGQTMLNAKYQVPEDTVVIPTDAASVERGKHLAQAVSVCVDCHGEKLDGGVVIDDALIGYAAAPNLTTGKGGSGNRLSDADMVRVLRYGVLADGHSARIMPSGDYQWLSDEDLGDIIAYVRSVPPVDKEWPDFKFGPLGRVLFGVGQLPIMIAPTIDVDHDHPAKVAQSVSKEYGDYLSRIAGCTGCHNSSLSGGVIPGAPPDWPEAANLTAGGDLKNWSEADFINTIRTGVNPTGKAINPTMPWPRYAQMSDEELKALWAHISTVPAKGYAER